MEKQIYNNNVRINYKIEGKGSTVVLIHGFLETSETWRDFSNKLSEKHLVITADLPGHGKSELYEEPYTMCRYAESIYYILQEEEIENALITGHSMGGYVALAFAENYPHMLSGLCLFHSSPFADNEEKKKNRDKVINQIKHGNKNLICSDHAKAVFADYNISTFKNAVSEGEKIAKSIPEEAVIASLTAMKKRKDRSEILKNLQVPFLYIFGNSDRFIPRTILNKIDFPKDTSIGILKNSGHTGMIEEKEKSLKLINDFADKVYF